MLCGLIRKRPPVEYADFSHRGIREVPSDLYDHRHTLQRLYLSTNQLTAVPKGLQRLENLTELDLSDNSIFFIPPTIGQLTKLKILDMSKNDLPNIPEAIQNCEELISISISGNPIGRLCEGITNLSQLRHLQANDCELDSLPDNIGRLTKLETLEARENHLMSLPQSISKLQRLEKLDLGCNVIEDLHPVIGTLHSLEELWMDMNLLMILPEEFGQLKKLTFLELSDNRLMELPESFGELESLTDLYLQKNLLVELPYTFGQLHNLQLCQVYENKLVELPEALNGLTSLIDFNLSYNHITHIPPSIGNLCSLKSLNIDENQISGFPTEIGNCTSLTMVTVRNNNLVELPSSISRLNKLSILNVVGNKLSRLPVGLASMTTISALWIAENQSRPMLEFQVQTDPETDVDYLTCVLFPQQGHELPYSESHVSSDSNLTRTEGLPTSVNFDPKLKNGDQKVSSVSRDPTPYPKELRSKIKSWRETRDIVPGSSVNEIQYRKVPQKVNRPRSLIKALSNPVQDGSGLVEPSNSRSSTLSPELFIHLHSSDIPSHHKVSPEKDVTSTDSVLSEKDTSNPASPDILLNDTTTIADANTNNSNNNEEDPTAVYVINDGDERTKSQLSNRESVTSTDDSVLYCNSPLTLPPQQNNESNDNEDLLVTPPPVCVTVSPPVSAPPAVSKRSVTPVLSPRTVPPQPVFDEVTTSLPPILQSTFNSGFSPGKKNCTHQNEGISHVRHNSDPADPIFSFSAPLQRSNDMPTGHQKYPQGHSKRLPGDHRFPSNKYPFMTENSRSRQLKLELVKSDTQVLPLAPVKNNYRQYASIDNFIGNRHPRTSTNDSQSSYYSNTSGRGTPDTPRFGYKWAGTETAIDNIWGGSDMQRVFSKGVYSLLSNSNSSIQSFGSVSSSGNDSGVELLRKASYPNNPMPRSASSNSNTLSHEHTSVGIYEVTLKKNPSLGLGITGGKDGENALRPGDKGFYVFRLVENMPAAKSGKVNVGDKILEVNGIEASNLTNDQLVKLLTSHETYVTLLFSREPSITLL